MQVIKNSLKGIDEYASGLVYEVGDIFSMRGSLFRATAKFTGATQFNDVSCVPINLGTGNATYQNIPLGSNPTWLKICKIKSYTAGTITIAGLNNGKQTDFLINFVTNYQTSQWDIRLSQHSVGTISQLSMRQPTAGSDIEVWIALYSNTAGWQCHVVANASGGNIPNKAVQFNGATPILVTTSPGGVGGHHHDWFPSNLVKEQHWTTVS